MSDKKKLSREEIAEIEVGNTEISSPVKWFLVLAFLFTIFGVPFVQYLVEVRADLEAGRSPSLLPKAFAAFTFGDQSRELQKFHSQAGLTGTLDLTRIINAHTLADIKDFEGALEEDSWLLKAVAPATKSILIGGLRSGSEDVYCGRDGWLFYRPSFDYLTARGFLEPAVLKRRLQSGSELQEPPQPDPVKAIIHFRDQLALRGIELVVLPAPAKATIYPERFSGRYEGLASPLQNPSYLGFLGRLESAGVRLHDPTDVLFPAKGENELFLETDSHWTPAGIDLVARTLADYLQKNLSLSPREPAGYVRIASLAENTGDLAHMLRLSEEQDLYRKQRVEIYPVRKPGDKPWEVDRQSEILFLGDSYANIYSLDGMGWGGGAGLVEQLSYYLQQPVDAIRINDQGSFSTRQQLGHELKRGEDRLAGKKVVVYEFAARELAVGDWKLIDLALGEKTGTADRATAVAGPFQVEGVIEEVTQPPRPGSTAYKDAIVAIHLKEVSADGKPFDPSEVVIFAWGMRDNTLTEASRYQTGQRLKVNVRPWSEVEQQYGSFQRIELTNDDTILLDLFWLTQSDDRHEEAPVRLAALEDPGKAADGPPLGRKIEPVAEETKPAAVTAPKPQPPKAGPAPAGPIPKPAEPAAGQVGHADLKAQFQERLLAIDKELEEKQSRVYPGRDGWLFSRQEISHITKGPFWGEAAQTVSKAAKPDSRDPLAAVLDFKQQLDSAEIELIVVPVPAKAHIYPDKLVDGIRPEQVGPDSRLDQVHQEFLGILKEAGVDTLDLPRLFFDARRKGGPDVFCQSDTHWSPAGLSLVAQALGERIAPRPWFKDLPKARFARTEEQISLKGDLTDDSTGAAQGMETVTISRIRQVEEGKESAVDSDRNSPILLVGDSHTLIFHSGGDMHAEGAGLPENLAYELGVNVDLVGVRGSGATPARVELARRRDNLAGKKLVIWCFTVREYTESLTGWRKVPVIR